MHRDEPLLATSGAVFLDGGDNGRDRAADGALPKLDFGTADCNVHLDADLTRTRGSTPGRARCGGTAAGTWAPIWT